MQVSAAVRLMPRPPARVHRRKTNLSESGLENLSIAAWRRLPLTRPSILSYGYLEKVSVSKEAWRTATIHRLPAISKTVIQLGIYINDGIMYEKQFQNKWVLLFFTQLVQMPRDYVLFYFLSTDISNL